MKRVPPSVRLKEEIDDLLAHGDADVEVAEPPMVGFVGRLARYMLQVAIEAEATAFLGREHYRRGSRQRTGWRNGYEPKHVQTEGGLLELAIPQLRGTEEPFQPRLAERLPTRTADLESLVRGMYVRGLSTQDVTGLFADTFGGSRLSKSTVSRVTQQLTQTFETWRRRDLTDLAIVYLFLDGQYHLVVMDGAPGLVKAVKRVWPRASRQRCLAHKMRNIVAKLPRLMHAKMKDLVTQVFQAPSYAAALKRGRDLVAKFKDRYPAAMDCLERDLEECVTYLRFPEAHHRRIRTTNRMERLNGESRRRTKVIPRFPTERSCLTLLYATLMTASKRWRGIPMTAAILRQLAQLRAEMTPPKKEEAVA